MLACKKALYHHPNRRCGYVHWYHDHLQHCRKFLNLRKFLRPLPRGIFPRICDCWQGLGIFLRGCRQSAQFPLHRLVPDAMGRTHSGQRLGFTRPRWWLPVCILSDACFPSLTVDTLLVVAYIGGITAVMAATIALVQDDIKRSAGLFDYQSTRLYDVGAGSGWLYLRTLSSYYSCLF